MQVNLSAEIKKLNILIIKRLFKLTKNTLNPKHIGPLQIRIIEYLSKHKNQDISQKDLELELNVSKSAISGVINTMEKKKLVERIPSSNDARKNKIILSEESLVFYNEMQENLDKLNEELLSSISEEELNDFLRIIEKLRKNIQKEGE